jgi:hypothetical protein
VSNNPIQNETTQPYPNTQKWYINNEKRNKRKKKAGVAMPIKIVTVFILRERNDIRSECRDTEQKNPFEVYNDDEASISSDFSNAAACCGDTAETHYNV